MPMSDTSAPYLIPQPGRRPDSAGKSKEVRTMPSSARSYQKQAAETVRRRGGHRTIGRSYRPRDPVRRPGFGRDHPDGLPPREAGDRAARLSRSPHAAICIRAPTSWRAKMTKELACVAGTVTLRVGTYGGVPEYSLWLAGDDGHGYFYIHINNDTPGTDDGKGGLANAFAPGLVSGAHVDARPAHSLCRETAATPSPPARICTSRSTRPRRCPRLPWTPTTAW